jgi:hypothetical protein
LAAWAVSAASLSRVSAISRSRPPSAHPIISADLSSTSPRFPRRRPRGMCESPLKTASQSAVVIIFA